ncbi:MAG: SGNH/GDSL hydrolase family protein [Solirubrobacteraceae bacterium]
MNGLRLSVLVALLALLLAGAPQARADASDVIVVGDSLAVGTQPYLDELLADRIALNDVRNGITTPQGMRLLRMALRTVTPRAVVVSLGSNDGPDPKRFADRLRRTMALLPLDTCVVWSTIIRPRRKGDYRGLNRVLHTFKRQERRLVVVDWEHAVTGGAVFLPDGLHADPAGYQYRGTMIADAVRVGCASKGLAI